MMLTLRLFVAAVFSLPLVVHARTVYVDDDATGNADGTSWTDAYVHLQDALHDPALQAGDEIWVAAGTYYPDRDMAHPTGTGDRAATFELVNGVKMYGGFEGTEMVLGQRPLDLDTFYTLDDPASLMTGDIGVPNDKTDNSYHVVSCQVCDENTVLDGFGIVRGYADGASPHDRGAGMLNQGGSPALRYLKFMNNEAYSTTAIGGSGGGMCNIGGSPHLIICIFYFNEASQHGGAILNQLGSSPRIDRCEISLNTAVSGGGAVANIEGSSPEISVCAIGANRAQKGGAIYNLDSSPVFKRADFGNNRAGTISNSSGGAIYNLNCSVIIQGCYFSGNYIMTITTGLGGAIHNVGGDLDIRSTKFFRNRSGTASFSVGGAIYNEWSVVSIKNSTFLENSANTRGGAIASDSSTDFTITNSILWDNDAPSDPEVSGMHIVVNYTDITGGYSGTANINQDPKLIVNFGHLQLRADSPCIDIGDNTVVEPGDTDAAGMPRIVGNVDLGAHEFPSSPPLVVSADFDIDGDVDFTDYWSMRQCSSGPAVPLASGCEERDLDGDNDVDHTDFAALQRCISGYSLPPDPACDD